MISIQGIYSVAQTVRLRAKELSDDIVFHFEDKKMTFAEYHSLSSQTANGLLAEGVQSGDRIAFLGKTHLSILNLLQRPPRCGQLYRH